MKSNSFFFWFVLALPSILMGQNTIPVPPVLEGPVFDLTMQQGNSEIYPGVQTATIGYNGALLGPTLIMTKGEMVTLNVKNQLNEMTTAHWHGLHVAPENDGGPHNPIPAGGSWSPAFEVMDHAATYWYHPHAHGTTLKQVVKGAAGFIIVRDSQETTLNLPRTYGIDDIPLVFQWKTFSNTKQIVELDEADNEVLINGVPKGSSLALPAQVIRLRLLNGSSHRFFDFGFANNLSFQQIASDAGLLNAPLSMTRLILAPGERAEILVDLTEKQGQSLVFRQFGTQLPQGYPGGTMAMMGGGGALGPLDNTNFDLMNITVTAPLDGAVTSIPTALTTNEAYSTSGAGARSFGFTAQPMMSTTNFFINGVKFAMETINFTAQVGNTEVWTITNQTMMAHPFHVHGNAFFVLSVGGAAPPENMRGRKDVIIVPPMGGQVKIIVRFDDFSDDEKPYMYHCHLLSHEEGGMMGQFLVKSSTSATHANAEDKSIRVSPNPAGSNEPIVIEAATNIVSLVVYDLDGQKLISKRGYSNRLETISYLPAGIYLFEITTGQGHASKKVVIGK